ncbi:hypothetical protein BDC45DRAFT_62329 [Circinella umbellata]|nr:hypothetical protein BDC45DRAFT_62329 [Circinella umbellata]
MKNALRNKSEARSHRDVKKRRQQHTASLQQQEQLQQQTGSSYTSRNTRGGTPHSITSSSSDTFSPCSPASDPKKLPSPANNSIKAINERISRLSIGNQLPNSKLPRRLQPSQSQQARLIPITPLQARATKSETTINKSQNITRCIRLQDEATTMAGAAIEIDRQCLRKQNNGNFHSIWRTRKNHRIIEESDNIHNDKNIYDDQTISGNDHLVEAAQSRLKNLLLAQERQLDMHEQLKQTFGDIVDQEEENGTELVQQLRVHIDQQAVYIQDLERALVLERSRKGIIGLVG